MKKISYLVLILQALCINTSAQVKRYNEPLSVQYKIRLSDPNSARKLTGMIEDPNGKLEQTTFELLINREKSFFALNTPPSMDALDRNAIRDLSDMLGERCFTGENSDVVFMDQPEFYVKIAKRVKWTITDEQKSIMGFKCSKAIGMLEKADGDGNFYDAYPLTAWFTKEISVPFGPNCQGNLPGLILQLEQRIVTFEAVEIKTENVVFPEKTNRPIITLKEYYDKIPD